MTQFNLFDTIQLTEAIPLFNEEIAPVGSTGTIVEIYHNGEAYEVELLGGWVKYDEDDRFVPSHPNESDSFVSSLGVATVYPHQICLIKPASETVGIRAQLLALLDELSTDSLVEMKNFAEFLKFKKSHSLEG